MLTQFLRRWLPVAAAVTILAGTGYAVTQQMQRLGANEVPVLMAEDAAARLDAGASPNEVIPGTQVDMAASLSPWLIVYGSDRKALGGSVRLHGRLPEYPTSAFANAPPGGRDTITWQPEPDVRLVTAIVAFKGGWVVAGRSLRLVEEREGTALSLSIAGWLAALLLTGATVLGIQFLLPTARGALNPQ